MKLKLIAMMLMMLIITAGVACALTDDYEYTVSDEGVTITRYKGIDADVIVPAQIDGLQVICLGAGAFDSDYNLRSVVLPEGLTRIEGAPFSRCFNLTRIILPDKSITIKWRTNQ